MKKKTIALGLDDFKKVVEGDHYLIDKSLLIKEALEDGAGVILFPRPRRWGKTLNMTMLRYFFEKSDQSNRHLFNRLAVEQYPEIMAHQGKYPVISLTLKEAKKLDWTTCYEILQSIITKEFERHDYLLTSELLSLSERAEFQGILSQTAKQSVYEQSLFTLCSLLHRYHNIEPIIIIDEYDAPIHAAFEHGHYKEVINFMQTFLGAALKGNVHLKKGFMTGILRVAKESIFSGLNNLSVCTLLDEAYSKHFGFAENEVQGMLNYYGPHENDTQMKLWYNNYQIGTSQSMYNPWSVLSYLNKNRSLLPHWMNSANNELIKRIIQQAPADFKEDIEQLMLGNTIEKERAEFVTFNSLYTSSQAAFTFLLFTGYLSFEKQEPRGVKQYLTLKIPNNEVIYFYQTTMMEWIEETISFRTYQNMLRDLTSGDIESFKESFECSVERALSSFDVASDEPEKIYHMFVLGMLICLQETHQILSNRESGTGRYDVMIIPKDINKIGIIIEFKRSIKETQEALEEHAKKALDQIKARNYQAELEARDITQIINLAIVFAGKKVLVQQG